jgi:hypothetical protein
MGSSDKVSFPFYKDAKDHVGRNDFKGKKVAY